LFRPAADGVPALLLVRLTPKETTPNRFAVLTQKVDELSREVVRRRAAEREAVRLVEELHAADRRKDEFLATLAHELRNPLAPIRNAVQVLNLTGADDPESRRVRGMIERQVSHLVRLVNDLLDLSRASLGKIRLQTAPVGLADVVRMAVETSGPAVEAGRHRLTVDAPAEPVVVDGDAVRLSQVVANLLNNAAKYTPEGGEIVVAVAREGGEAVVRVRDSGLGIPPEMLSKVFDMFTQVNRHLGRSQGGLGIGLTLVRRLVEMHGGTVGAASGGDGMGAEFEVRLPLGGPLPDPAASPAASPAAAAAAPGRRRVLVADDNKDAAESLALLLSMMGNDVRTAADGQEAVEVAAAFRPDVAVLDIGMPRMDGNAAARRIRGEAWGKGMVLIALTGWGQDEDRRRTAEAGFDLHLTKPVDPSTLESRFEELSRKK
ncbi:MAG TPA: ATP-binding protein, partial [Urbifossiella sp.]|nr:ATP-binding protein [Urbifossiella sp.]